MIYKMNNGPPYDTNRIVTRVTDHVAIKVQNSSEFVVRNPGGFVPDEIRVSAVGNFAQTTVYEVRSNMMSNRTLCIFEGYNYYNPTSIHLNNSRETFNGTYSVQLWDIIAKAPVTTANKWIVLTFEFIRYE